MVTTAPTIQNAEEIVTNISASVALLSADSTAAINAHAPATILAAPLLPNKTLETVPSSVAQTALATVPAPLTIHVAPEPEAVPVASLFNSNDAAKLRMPAVPPKKLATVTTRWRGELPSSCNPAPSVHSPPLSAPVIFTASGAADG